MDFILHGKPNAGCHRTNTNANAAFYNNIVDGFFQAMNGYKGELLFIDIREWEGVRYSVYTYLIGNEVKDTSDRASYFAMTLVFKDSYLRMVSNLLSFFRNALKKYVYGTYLNTSNKYIVTDFNDNGLFKKFTAVLYDFENFGEKLDKSFAIASLSSQPPIYNPDDCDSPAFINALKKYGRVVVSSAVLPLSSMAVELTQEKGKVGRLEAEVVQNRQTIKQNNDNIAELKRNYDELAHQSATVTQQIAGWKSKYEGERKTRESAESRCSELQKETDTLAAKLAKAGNSDKELSNLRKNNLELSGKLELIAEMVSPYYTNQKTEYIQLDKDNNNKEHIAGQTLLSSYLKPNLNTVLIILLGILMLCLYKCSDDTSERKVESHTVSVAQEESEYVKSNVEGIVSENVTNFYQSESTIETTNGVDDTNSAGVLYQTQSNLPESDQGEVIVEQGRDNTAEIDIDCNLVVKQNDIVVWKKGTQVGQMDINTPVTVTVTEKDGYNFRTSGLSTAGSTIKNGTELTLVPADNANRIIIWYRSGPSNDNSKGNLANKFVLTL